MIKFVKKIIVKVYIFFCILLEKNFQNKNYNLKYVLFRKKNTKKLLIIFSSYPGIGKKARYNYIIKFRKIPVSRLYILDNFGFEKKGAYYLGEDGELLIANAVYELIEQVRKELKVDKKNVVTCGSSKGGFAAIYFECKYNYGASIVGAPQIKLGDYLSYSYHKPILKSIMGSDGPESRDFLNKLLFDTILAKPSPPSIKVHVSKNEKTYQNHVLPLVEFSLENKLDISFSYGLYKEHNLVGKHFPGFLINEWLNKFKT